MASGIVKILPASTHALIALSGQGGGTQFPSVAILNPNDGVLYVARNRDCASTNYGDWDWKVPSQSYALLPGPFSGVGAFYLDQSGAGRQGEISIYSTQRDLDIPMFGAIGRALQAIETTLDVTEGIQPANPGSGILRLWADTNDFLHALNGAGTDATLIDTLSTLSGVLTGHLPNPGMAAGAAAANIGALGGVLAGTLPNPSFAAPAYTPWTPTVQQGGITLTITNVYSVYYQIGKHTVVSSVVSINSAGAAVAINVSSLPGGAKQTSGNPLIGAFLLLHGGAFRFGGVVNVSAASVQFFIDNNTNVVGVTPAIALASGDSLAWFGIYEAA